MFLTLFRVKWYCIIGNLYSFTVYYVKFVTPNFLNKIKMYDYFVF